MSNTDQVFDLDDGQAMALYGQTLAAAVRYHQRGKDNTYPVYSANRISIDGETYSLQVEIDHEPK
jgi:hypothetical protein